ncbi:hypothetical protein BTJ40_08680 [Microbulbifer sp. A4B17]|uniref:hypothetical protein n=1 Tax=Microbulbifer sp. A4B17 TaxID=359370 RepID=UPI000D52D028|nr:hypothetical protein [Microbulbifer sp. A4B17]AWF80873.1 hypothetical protein BTJ40_08680 [Microbulbifer sp. A4B17]
MFTARSTKKVQFCVALSLIVAALQVGQVKASELTVSQDGIHRELTQKIDQQMLKKLSECTGKSMKVNRLPPVRIAEEKAPRGGMAYPYSKARMMVM